MPTFSALDKSKPTETEIAAAAEAAWESKRQQMHKGSCSSPAGSICPCPEHCPLHGRCCDCIHHHTSKTVAGPRDLGWTPACIREAAGNIIGDLECFRNGYPVPYAGNLEPSSSD